MLSVGLALSAGLCAAIASLCAKLAFSSDLWFYDDLCTFVQLWVVISLKNCDKVIFLSRMVIFALTFLFNAMMWTLFVKSMRNSSSAQAMITNSASNFLFSALFGKLFFGETLSIQWWLGASLIVLGLCIINKNKKEDPTLRKGL